LKLKNEQTEHVETVLSYVLEDIVKALGRLDDGEKMQVAITVPAFFTSSQRNSLKVVVQSVGFEAVQVVNENSAAALALVEEFTSKAPETVLIYNSGASTTQASVVTLEVLDKRISAIRTKKLKSVQVLSHSWGHLGLTELDTTLAEVLAGQYQDSTGQDLRDNSQIMKSLRKLARTVNTSDKQVIEVNFKSIGLSDLKVEFTQESLSQIYAKYRESFVKVALDAISKAGLAASDLAHLHVIGGGSSSPFIGQILNEAIGLLDNVTLDPLTIAARGAVLQVQNTTSAIQDKHVRPTQILLTDILLYDYSATLRSLNLPDKSFKLFPANSPYSSTKRVSLTHKFDSTLQLYSSNSEEPIGTYFTQEITVYNEQRKQTNKTSVNYYSFSINLDGVVVLDEVESRMNVTMSVKREVDLPKAINAFYKEQFNKTVDWNGGVVPKGVEKHTSEVWTVTDFEKIKCVFDEALPKSFGEADARQIKQRLDSKQALLKKTTRRASLIDEFHKGLEFMQQQLMDSDFNKLITFQERSSLTSLIREAGEAVVELKEANESELMTTLLKYKAAFQVFLDRQAESKAYEVEVEHALTQLDDLSTQLKKLNYTKTWVTQEVKDAVMSKFNDLASWIVEKINEQKDLAPWKPPVLTTKLLKSKLMGAERLVEDIKSIPRPKKQLVVRDMQHDKQEAHQPEGSATQVNLGEGGNWELRVDDQPETTAEGGDQTLGEGMVGEEQLGEAGKSEGEIGGAEAAKDTEGVEGQVKTEL
jgi:molecular chaperone DnaK (HSP70)